MALPRRRGLAALLCCLAAAIALPPANAYDFLLLSRCAWPQAARAAGLPLPVASLRHLPRLQPLP